MSSGEIITLQLGNYSNFVGTHYWNIQNEQIVPEQDVTEGQYLLQKSKLFRNYDEKTQSGSSKPRLISIDLKGSLHSLSETGSFLSCDDDLSSKGACDGLDDVDLYKQQREEKALSENGSELLNPKSWTDYMRYDLHSNSLYVVDEYIHTIKDYKFTYCGLGEELYKSSSLADELEDKLHYWVEECDNIEGFQIFCDVHDGFSGIGRSVITDIQEEYGSKSRMLYANWPTRYYETDMPPYLDNITRLVNLAQAIQGFHECVDLYTLSSLRKSLFGNRNDSIKIPSVPYEPSSLYQTSSVLASAINATTLPWRACNRSISMRDVCQQVSQAKWRLAQMSFGAADVLTEQGNTFLESSLRLGGLYDKMMTKIVPNQPRISSVPTTQMMVLYGLPQGKMRPQLISPDILGQLRLNRDTIGWSQSRILELLNEHFYPSYGTSSICFAYQNSSNKKGLPLSKKPRKMEKNGEAKLISDSSNPTLASLFTSADSHDLLQELVTLLSKVNVSKFHALQEWGLDADTLCELQEQISNICQVYDFEKGRQEYPS